MIDAKAKEFLERTNKLLKAILKVEKGKYAKDYLGRVLIHDTENRMVAVDLFKCRQCERIITANQFNFSTLCAACDIGKPDPPPYKITEVDPKKTLSRIKKDAEKQLEKFKEGLEVKPGVVS